MFGLGSATSALRPSVRQFQARPESKTFEQRKANYTILTVTEIWREDLSVTPAVLYIN